MDKAEIDKMLEACYSFYPRKEGKFMGMQVLKKIVKTEDDCKLLCVGVQNFAKKIEREGTEKKYIPLWSTFCNQRRWYDYLEEDSESTSSDWGF